MSEKLPWFPFYGRDFFGDDKVKQLNLRQIGIYMCLLWHEWEHGSIPIANDCMRFPGIASEAYQEWCNGAKTNVDTDQAILRLRDDLDYVHLRCFQKHPSLKNHFINPRLEQIRQDQEEERLKNHSRAMKGGLALQAKLKLGSSSSISQANDQPKQADLESESESSPNHKNDSSKIPPTPHHKQITTEEIRTRWNDIPNVKPCEAIEEGLLARVNALRSHHGAVWWERLFATVADSPFLTGQVPGTNGKKPFRANLGWVVGKQNLAKVLAGNYKDDVPTDAQKLQEFMKP